MYFLISGSGFAAGLFLSMIATLLSLHRRRHTLRLALTIHAFDALQQAKELPEHCCVLIEIGGNDLLGGEPSGKFDNDLRSLLSEVCTK